MSDPCICIVSYEWFEFFFFFFFEVNKISNEIFNLKGLKNQSENGNVKMKDYFNLRMHMSIMNFVLKVIYLFIYLFIYLIIYLFLSNNKFIIAGLTRRETKDFFDELHEIEAMEKEMEEDGDSDDGSEASRYLFYFILFYFILF